MSTSAALSDVLDIARRLRDVLQGTGHFQDDDILEVLRQREDLYSYVYTQVLNGDEDECGGSPGIHDVLTAGSCSTGSYESGRQHAVVGDGGPLRTRAISSSSSTHDSIVDGELDKQEKRRLKDEGIQARSPARWHSQGPQAAPETSDVESQTQRRAVSWYAELVSTLKNRDAEVVELEESFGTLRQGRASEERLQHPKIDGLHYAPHQTPETLRSAAELSNRACKKKRTPAGTNEKGQPGQPVAAAATAMATEEAHAQLIDRRLRTPAADRQTGLDTSETNADTGV
ncbi:hypothetical protein HPB52_018655 [Rhipicephalus sanguineus]|uniref:Uncharacterized protein n=1 Tax=Rhipicephalus sanguineus TaxID=34632 RepID=A0A9D4Q4J8_RHISA|nr:hypothetical protein HPB52_018655 [Rhipicephalus sanguineus]